MAADHLSILTFPVGLVVGEHEFEMDLGPSRAPAELRLDGSKVCDVGGNTSSCMVDLGGDPQVHLLELVRYDSDGNPVAGAQRWINRPGQEAELSIQLEKRDSTGICRGSVIWLHPRKFDPAVLRILHNGRGLRIGEDGHSFAFPCPDPGAPDLMTASAIFTDGRRAEDVAVAGGFGSSNTATMTAVSLIADDAGNHPCQGVGAATGQRFQMVASAGFEVVFVLDPDAGYRGILGTAGTRYSAGGAWRRADASLFEAEQIWFVRPDSQLQRISAFSGDADKGMRSSNSKLDWLIHLFEVATMEFTGTRRLADAVAASGLVAASGPQRRAIVLILGNRADRDDSLFTPAQAQAYLEEIGVPLHVLRIGKVRDDGWPEGERVLTMRNLAISLEAVRARIDQQCVAWLPRRSRVRRNRRQTARGASPSQGDSRARAGEGVCSAAAPLPVASKTIGWAFDSRTGCTRRRDARATKGRRNRHSSAGLFRREISPLAHSSLGRNDKGR